jgi:hypothetical protein
METTGRLCGDVWRMKIIDNARDAGQRALEGSADRPIAMLLGGLAVGFLVGMLLPVTSFESRRVGPIANDVKDKLKDASVEVARRGTDVIRDTIEGAREAAASSIRDNAGIETTS